MEKDGDKSSYRAIAGAILIAAMTAVIGYVLAFVTEHRKSEFDSVNTQIEKLYGPLAAYSLAAYKAQGLLHETYRPGTSHYFNKNDESMPTITRNY